MVEKGVKRNRELSSGISLIVSIPPPEFRSCVPQSFLEFISEFPRCVFEPQGAKPQTPQGPGSGRARTQVIPDAHFSPSAETRQS